MGTGNLAMVPNWTYERALENITQLLMRELGSSDALNNTTLSNDSTWAV
jgi:hypothetical protein